MAISKRAFAGNGFGRKFAWVDLANSEQWDGFGRLTDHLLDPLWLQDFLRHWRYRLPVAQRRHSNELVRLRRTLRRAAEQLASGAGVHPKELAEINAVLVVPSYARIIKSDGAFRRELSPLRLGWPWVRAQIAASFVDFLVHYQSNRLKICPNRGCRWAFYDVTKGNTRRWCNDRRCGNRDRVRRARAAQKRRATRRP